MEDTDWMESWEDVDDSDASPSKMLAKRLARRRRQGGGRKSVVPAGGPQAASPRGEMSRIYETMKRLEEKQEEQTRALAAIQSRSSGEQTGDLFRYSLSAAALQATPAAMSGDVVGALSQTLPLVQNWRGIAPSFAAKPISTVAFPIIAAGVFAIRKPRTPTLIANTLSTAAGPVRVTVVSPENGDIHFNATGRAGIRAAVGKGSPRAQNNVIDVPQNFDGFVEVRVFQFLRGSDTAVLEFTP
jgi:hypothetical protein